MLKTKHTKIYAMVITLIMLFTYAIFLTGKSSIVASAFNPVLIEKQEGITGNATYLNTVYKYEYASYTSVKLVYEYTCLDPDGEYEDSETGITKDIDYRDTLELLTFDSEWNGWDKTTVGPSAPVLHKNYTAVIPISSIENKLSTGGDPFGINLQTGGIGETQITIISYQLISSDYTQQEFTAEGSWFAGTDKGTMEVTPKGAATVFFNEFYITVGGMNLENWTNPTVDITVTYPSVQTNSHYQLTAEGKVIDESYINADAGTYTYTIELSSSTITSFIASFDGGTVTKIHMYDNISGDVETSVTGKTAEEIAEDMGVAWNLGNSLEAVGINGKVDEKGWGNPKTTKKLIQAVKSAGFNTIRIPVSYLDKIGDGPDYKIDADYLDRVQQVVDYAYDMGMYAIIDIHGDGFNDIDNYWIDISVSNVTQAYSMLDKFRKVWAQIANKFADYDQKLIFEAANELMISGNYNQAPDPAYSNINALNQVFVNAVRASGNQNKDRVLIVSGYNTDIDLTVSPTASTTEFIKPADTEENRLMLSVHYLDPYDFTLNNNGVSMWGSNEELLYMCEQFNKISSFATSLNMPVFLGEYGAMDKNNIAVRASYCYWLNYYAAENGIVTSYWDNGHSGRCGTALFDRTNNVITIDGQTIVDSIIDGYVKGYSRVKD